MGLERAYGGGGLGSEDAVDAADGVSEVRKRLLDLADGVRVVCALVHSSAVREARLEQRFTGEPRRGQPGGRRIGLLTRESPRHRGVAGCALTREDAFDRR